MQYSNLEIDVIKIITNDLLNLQTLQFHKNFL